MVNLITCESRDLGYVLTRSPFCAPLPPSHTKQLTNSVNFVVDLQPCPSPVYSSYSYLCQYSVTQAPCRQWPCLVYPRVLEHRKYSIHSGGKKEQHAGCEMRGVNQVYSIVSHRFTYILETLWLSKQNASLLVQISHPPPFITPCCSRDSEWMFFCC